ncbi:MAG TPA: acyloxyacyl hydrolase [Nitrospiraceae bacterium]|nr:acyloxyacyl hydrolase [Nitrospiraceae bacterium]
MIRSRHICLIGVALVVLGYVGVGYCDEMALMAVGLRGGISVKGESPLGEQMREDFTGGDVFGLYRLPWSWYSKSGWGVGTRLITSAGALSALEKVALVSSVTPLLALGTQDGRFTIDAGLGGALISAHRFGRHDLGGPFQFTATAGISIMPFKPLGVGYRFQHYSDGTIYGTETRGVDLHMIELTYRY